MIVLALVVGMVQEPVKSPVELAFDHFKRMPGKWAGAADDGRRLLNDWQLIAGGSVVMYESEFEGHPDTKMVTMIHVDNGRLLLTHYCVARNQPRLEATDISKDGKKITFTYLDATGIKSRDQGHMDKVVWEFVDEDTETSQWTWFQDGKESWMEKFTMKRVKGELPPAAPVVGKSKAPCCPVQA